MIQLPYTVNNVALIQEFLDETRKRIADGVEITFTRKANNELAELTLDYDIDLADIENAIQNLTTENYYTGVDPSPSSDFDVCAFCTFIGKDAVEIYLKYGLEIHGLQILLFSNHVPNHPMTQPFKN